MLTERIIQQFLSSVDHIQYGSLTLTLPEGETRYVKGHYEGADAEMSIYDARTITALAAKGDIGLMESYRNGWWDSDDLPALLLLGLQNEAVIEPYLHGSALAQFATRILYFFSRNTLRGSKQNIQAHYDLGNDFYQLWLDETMSYSAAIFDGHNEALALAQNRKYDRILDQLETSSGNLLEIGCGWGGFAERATTKHDFDLKAITLSEEQHAYATKRLDGNANIVLEDYRKQEGLYKNIISIEMFEAVGEKFWPAYFGKMASLLDQKGKAVIQTITIDDAFFERYRKGGDMIRSFIFPGGMLPTETRFAEESSKVGLRVTDTYRFGDDYAETLRRWLNNFEAQIPHVKKLGFDEGFIRVWRMYLAACIAGFTTGRTNVVQVELQHA